MCKKLICLVFFMLALGIAQGATWDRAAYWDSRYPTAWADDSVTIALRDFLGAAGYTILNADQLKTWMDARIADKALSVVVFCRDIVPDTVAETMTSTCTLRQYLDAGGKVVWYSDWPIYYQGHSDGSQVTWGAAGATSVLGFDASGGPNDSGQQVVFTQAGVAWGLTETWPSARPTPTTITENLTALATVSGGASAAAWVKHYLPGDNYRGFVRYFDVDTIAGSREPDFGDIQRLAEYIPLKATNPSPPSDGSMLNADFVSLTWDPGLYAALHDVYVGTSFSDVNTATTSSGGVYKGRQAELLYPVDEWNPMSVTRGLTYYWRIDEVNGTNKVDIIPGSH